MARLTERVPLFKSRSLKTEHDPWVMHLVNTYGDMLFDLCQSMLWSASSAPWAFRTLLKRLTQAPHDARFQEFERAWVLSESSLFLLDLVKKQGRRLSSSEQMMLDSTPLPQTRLKHFESYFHRLAADDQILLLYKDKYGIPYHEISSALSKPELSLKVQRQHALQALEEWIWGVSQ